MKYSCATLWHKLPGGNYKRILFDRVLITKKRGANIGGSVVDSQNSMRARIFLPSKIDISIGDMIFDGYEASLSPTPDAYIIKEIKENFSTSANLRHYNIMCV
ncbi:MAG: hypothetical protein IKK18_04050 [Clostridia bacterium]|nr:hypothetical protein [Clostridia bacterium]